MTHALLIRAAIPSLAAALLVGGCRKERVENMPVGGNAETFLSVSGDDDATPAAEWSNYGDEVMLDREVVPVAKVLADPEAYEGKELTLEGVVSDVCAKRGCWLRIADEKDAEASVFVKLTCDESGVIVPLDSSGDKVRARGKIVMETVSEADARHLAEDAGESPEAIAKIVGPQKSLNLQTKGVWLADAAE